ncbi:FISUMP domain-containing protein [Fibrobacter sp. UWEL]|uniref:FISUMP domain-containing protein n=1 Tax=Fibrobacter sp. UWEL TaxID=1896209 RepID=UPI0011601534|nr:FISUMP domain-containing protein [Fibrobacter sp. UWEL]
MLLVTMLLAACGDDGSTGSPTGVKDDESSSSVEESSSSVAKSSSSSSVIPDSDRGSSSSSSAKASSSSSNVISSEAERSSSSAKSSSSSSVTLSGGSAGVEGSSSSVAKSSSSSAKSSSSSAKSSSSSVKVSSSSEYVPFNHSVTLAGEFEVGEDAYKQFVDERNGRSYYYITIAGKDTSGNPNSVTVMAENLNIGEMVRGIKEQSDDTKIERYCYKNDTTRCDMYGALYQWAEMMQLPSSCNTESCADKIEPNHQGICPDGWRLLTYNDFYTIWHANTNDEGVKGLRSSYFSGSNYTGYSLLGSGIREKEGNFTNIGMGEFWYYPVEREYEGDAGSYVQTNSLGTSSIEAPGSNSLGSKTYGRSVRCVKLETEE